MTAAWIEVAHVRLVMVISGLATTVVIAVPVLFAGFGSVVVLDTVAELEITVRCGVPTLTFTTSVKIACVPDTIDGDVAVTVPVPPAGTASVRVQPPGTVNDTRVVLAGIASDSDRVWASLEPLFVTVMV